MKGKAKQLISGFLAIMTITTSVMQPMITHAASEEESKVPLLEDVRELLDADEIVTAKDMEIEFGSSFDEKSDFSNLEFDGEKVKVTFHDSKNESGEAFTTEKSDVYQTIYYVEPMSGHPQYQVSRNLIVKDQPESEQEFKEDEMQDTAEEMVDKPEKETEQQPETEPKQKEPVEETISTATFAVDVPVEEIKDLTDSKSEEMIVVASLDSKAAKGSDVKVDVGRRIQYPTSLGSYSTCLFYVDGHLAYCLESAKATPEEDGYVGEVLNGNENLKKALYYGYGGAMDKTGERLASLDNDTRYIFTHIAASYFYVGESAFAGCSKSDLKAAGVMDWIDYLASMPGPMDPTIRFSTTSTKAEVSGDVQKTGTIKLSGDSRNFVSLRLPNQVTYHCSTTGGSQTGGVVKIYGGQSFYFTAPYEITGTWESGSLSGNVSNIWQALVVSTGNTTQDVGAGYYTEQKASPINFSVKWLDYAEVKVSKKDDTTGNGLVGAVFGIYSDTKCTKLLAKMSDTDGNGIAAIKIPRTQETVYLKEITAPVGYQLNMESFHVTLVPGGSRTVQILDKRTTANIKLVKLDRDTKHEVPQGDASLEKAVYGLYARENINHPDGHTGVLYAKDTLVDSFVTDATGRAQLKNLYLGEYYVKEITPPEGYLKDENSYNVSLSYEGGTVPEVERTCTVTEQVMKQAFEIIKVCTDGSSTETKLVEGAEFTVKLESEVKEKGWDASVPFDTLVTDEKGYARSKELPYGTYVVKETKTPEEMNTTKDFTVQISEDSRTPQVWRTFNDAPFTAYIRMIKKDVETGKVVLLGGTTFKIKNVKTGKDVSMKVGNKHISVFETDESGMVTTPLQLLPGKYEVYEITAPFGYVVHTDAIPFTVTGKGGFYPDEDGDFVIDVEIENKQQYGNVNIYKHGEQLTGLKENTVVAKMVTLVKEVLGVETEENLDFIYEDGPIEGTEFKLVVDQTIYTADHQVDEEGKRIVAEYEGVSLDEGAVVAVLTTDKEGKANIKNLPLGKYHVEETVASHGFALNKKVDAFELEYAGQDVEIVAHNSDFENQRVKANLSLTKRCAETNRPVEGAVYGLYAAESIKNKDGEVILRKETLIEQQMTDEKGQITFVADVPLGKYYVKEVKAPSGYLLDTEKYDVDLTYQGQSVEVVLESLKVSEVPITLEVKKTDITTGVEIEGAHLQIVDEEGNVFEEWVSTKKEHVIYGIPAGDYTLIETLAPLEDGYVKAQDVEFTVEETGEVQQIEMKDDYTKVEISKTDITSENELPGASLTILDENGKEVESWVSTEKAHYIEKLPVGKYVLRETAAPDGYQIANDVEFEVKETGEIQKVVMVDEKTPEKQETPKYETPKSDTPASSTTTSTKSGPKTGDSTALALWLLLLGMSGVGVVGAMYMKKRKCK